MNLYLLKKVFLPFLIVNMVNIVITSTKPKTVLNRYIKVSSNPESDAHIIISCFIDIWEAGKRLRKFKGKNIVIDICELDKKFRYGFLNRAVQGLYRFHKYKTTSDDTIDTITIYDKRAIPKDFIDRLECANYVRELLNEPANKTPPEGFCQLIKDTFEGIPDVQITIFNEMDIHKKELGLVEAVGMGSVNPPRFLLIEYSPQNKAPKQKTICLLGKGVTMDTGGYSLKQRDSMLYMNFDDTGGSLVAGLIKYFATSKHHVRLIGIVPLVENAISGWATKPGNVVKAYNGKTVEITNTDGEGRLILADALAYACKNYTPDYIIDLATLTGWSERIHCHTSYTYFTLDEDISKKIIDIGESYAEKSMRLPPWPEYTKLTRSDIADYKNYYFSKCENSDGFMAAMFLLNFVNKKYHDKWIHFDIKHKSLDPNTGLAEGFLTFVELIQKL